MLRPIGDYILITPGAPDTTSAGGILLPASTQEAQTQRRGVVVAVGSGIPALSGGRIAPDVAVGDVIIYRYGEDINFGGEDYQLVREKEIVAVVE